MGAAGDAGLEQELQALVAEGAGEPHDDARFNDLALRVFRAQFERDPLYRELCSKRMRTPQTVTQWEDIPAAPLAVPAAEQRAHRDNALARAAQRQLLSRYLFPDQPRIPVLLVAAWEHGRQPAALRELADAAARACGADQLRSFVREGALDSVALAEALAAAVEHRQPVCMVGGSADYSNFLDYCAAHGLRFQLPEGSRLLDTPAAAAAPLQPPRDELYSRCRELLGLPTTGCINAYRPAGGSSCFIDNMLYNAHRRDWSPRYKVIPPWARTQIIESTTMQPVQKGHVGLLRHIDLANLHATMVIQTQDLGVAVAHGFEVVGTAEGESN